MSIAPQKDCIGGEEASRKCPQCHSEECWKDGVRKTRNGAVQRYMCRECGYRFSETSVLSTNLNNRRERQVCATLTEAKNLTRRKPLRSGLAGATKLDKADVRGKVVEFAWWIKKNGYRESTIRVAVKTLRVLAKRGAELLNPESVKETIARQSWAEATKLNASQIYTLFLKMQGLTWEQPIYKAVEKVPFIPTEKEIDDLIAGCGRKTAAYLQLLKETGMRSGEADNLKWIDIDMEGRTVRITPEKHSKPRLLKLSQKCLVMLQNLPKRSEKVFGDLSMNTMRTNLSHSRKRLARKLGNPRLAVIHFHTLRHWKATMLYHQTKDILYVKEFLGHKRIDTTLKYVQLEQVLFDKDADSFNCRVAKTPEQIRQLIEAGFEYVTEKDGLIYFRKRK